MMLLRNLELQTDIIVTKRKREKKVKKRNKTEKRTMVKVHVLLI